MACIGSVSIEFQNYDTKYGAASEAYYRGAGKAITLDILDFIQIPSRVLLVSDQPDRGLMRMFHPHHKQYAVNRCLT